MEVRDRLAKVEPHLFRAGPSAFLTWLVDALQLPYWADDVPPESRDFQITLAHSSQQHSLQW